VAIWESLKPNYAWAEQVPKDDKRLKTSYETVASPAGNGSIKGYFARPATISGKIPAVLVIHENRGLNPHRGRRAPVGPRQLHRLRRTASPRSGYPGDEEKAAAAFRTVDGPKMTEDFVASASWVKARPESNGKLGAVGFCFGGGIVNQLAVRLGKDLSAGRPSTADSRAPRTRPRSGAARAALRRQRPGRGRRHPGVRGGAQGEQQDLQRYMHEGAQHGFHNDTTPRYDEAAAKLAWQRTIDLFNKNLR
jgi:carboxymethylenebutenolidase